MKVEGLLQFKMAEEGISNIIQHLKILLEETSISSSETTVKKNLNSILKAKVENFNNTLGLLRPNSQFEEEISYHEFYLKEISSSRCEICCQFLETTEFSCNKELNEKEEFALLCLGILLKLNTIERNETCSGENNEKSIAQLSLGIRDQKFVTAALQFIICLGILPNFYPGVGIPVSQRTGFGQYFEENKERKIINEPFLLQCIEKLCLIAKSKLLGALVITKFLGDLIAGLIQIGFQKQTTERKSFCKDISKGGNIDDINEVLRQPVCQHEREWCRNELYNLVNRVYQPLVIRELLLLQGVKRTATQKSPKWLRQICGKILSERLLQKNGLHFVVNAILEECNMDGNAAILKFDMIGRLVSSCPMIATSVEEYYKEISPQILDLLNAKSTDEKRNFMYSCVASHCISWMAKTNLFITKENILMKIMSAFHLASSDSIDSNCADICNEESITKSVEQIHKVFILGTDPKDHMIEILSAYGQPLFELYCFLRNKISHLKSLLKEILLWIIQNNATTKALIILTTYLFGEVLPNTEHCDLRTMNAKVVYSNSPCGGAMLVRIDDEMKVDNTVSTEERIVGILDLLISIKDKKIVGELFVHLLKQLTVMTYNSNDSKSDVNESLLQIDENIKTLKFKIPLVSMIAAMCDKLGNNILDDPKQLLQFVKLNLERCCCCSETSYTSCSGDVFIDGDDTKEETISMSLGILSLVISNIDEVQPTDYKELQEFLPVLKKISEKKHSRDVQKLCEDLYVSIATYGTINDNENHKSNNKKGSISDLKSEEAYNQAMVELSDPLIPVRGHSLLQLSHLIEARNPKAISHIEKLLNVFMDNLCHDDTYIYLAAVQGLVSLSELKHDIVIPHLAREFALFGCEAGTDERLSRKCFKTCENKVKKHHSPEMRMKIGEALVKATRNCGPLLPRYSQVLLASLLTGVKDKDNDVRASSLSNIGDVCKLLRFSIGPIIHEIFMCISSVLKSDADAKVRKAALLVITMLLEGLGKDAFDAIGEVLRDLYRLLKLILLNEKTDDVKWQAEMALGELESIMKDYLFPEQTLQKKIQIIN